jgi:hypothetical protein
VPNRTYDTTSDHAFLHTGARQVQSPPRRSAAQMPSGLERQLLRTMFHAEQTANRTNSPNNMRHTSGHGDNENNVSHSHSHDSDDNHSDDNHSNDNHDNFYSRETLSLSSLNAFSEAQMPTRQFLPTPEPQQGDSFDLLRNSHVQCPKGSKDTVPSDILHQASMVQDHSMNFDLFDGKYYPKRRRRRKNTAGC